MGILMKFNGVQWNFMGFNVYILMVLSGLVQNQSRVCNQQDLEYLAIKNYECGAVQKQGILDF